ncbi:hypothetical protein [Ruegeria lacuscaerulensis]|uniref:hypothetical protein n=1 Tax=Ruegeria lacuscaerulensis TaxID=55218 RepID=UPI00147B9E3C|nr:hypothetical protein [Ruegeria lacuscaerulensis]
MSKSRLTNKKGQWIFDPAGAQKGSKPGGQITAAWTDHDPKPLPWIARDGSGATASGRSCWGVLGGSRYVGWNLESAHEPTGSGFANNAERQMTLTFTS